jgi:epoxyqueuosine reductase
MGLDIRAFFTEEGIDVFSEVSVINLTEADRRGALQLLPGASSVIVFGKEVPAPAYKSTAEDKTRVMLRIAEALDNSAIRLARCLNEEHLQARPVPLYLPVQIREGHVQGLVRLKNVASSGKLGSIGKSSLLLSPHFGPRLLLSGVVTNRPVPESIPGDEIPAVTGSSDSIPCTGCGRCITVCPGGAFGPEGVDVFRCLTVRAWISPPLVPLVLWILGRKTLLSCAAPFAPWIARMATIPCSLCVTECPLFEGSKVHDQNAEGEI